MRCPFCNKTNEKAIHIRELRKEYNKNTELQRENDSYKEKINKLKDSFKHYEDMCSARLSFHMSFIQEQQMKIKKLESEITTLKQKLSHYEKEENKENLQSLSSEDSYMPFNRQQVIDKSPTNEWSLANDKPVSRIKYHML